MANRDESVYLPFRAQAGGFFVTGLVLLVGAGVGAAFGSTVLAIVLGSLAITPVLIGALVQVLAGRYERNARALLTDPDAIRWDYPRAQWQAHVASERGRGRHLPLVFAGVFALSGFVFSLAMTDDGDTIGGSKLLTFVVPPLCGVALGLGIGAVTTGYRRATLARMTREDGVFCIGKGGLYLTGSYWPLAGLGVSITGIERDGDTLLFRFAVTRGGTQTVRVPIPDGHDAEADALVAMVAAGGD